MSLNISYDILHKRGNNYFTKDKPGRHYLKHEITAVKTANWGQI
jgi:hypothetical protein